MAELAVGLSKSVVEGALTKVRSAIDDDSRLRQKAQRDLVSISMEFRMMQSFLNVASEQISVKNNLVMTWVDHVRDLAYDVEDHVEFVVHLDSKPIFWRRMLPSCVAPTLPLDEAVAGIEELKARAEELSKCYRRYSHITDSDSSKLVMLQQPASTAAVGAKALAMLFEASEAAERNRGLQNLTHLITNEDEHLQVISVWGTNGDLGKTSIMRKAYDDPSIISNFSCRAWVKLMHPFNPREFIRRFMTQVLYMKYSRLYQEEFLAIQVINKMEANNEDTAREFHHTVMSERYLVVLDNLSDMVDWDAIRSFFPERYNGSRIIVSTQQFEVATLCPGQSYQAVMIEKFSADHSVYAFFRQGMQSLKQTGEFILSNSHVRWPSTVRDLVGRWPQLDEFQDYLINASSRSYQVISVCGIAGVGKSAFVRNCCYHVMVRTNPYWRCRDHPDELCDCFGFEKCGWAAVSHPFDLGGFCQSLLLEPKEKPIQECQRLLQYYRCLVVIDDLQSKQEWDLIKSALVPSISKTGSLIIVITNEASVAAYCTNNSELVFNVKGLEADDAFHLFRNEVLKKNASLVLKDQKDLETQELISKCGGLAKVIVAAASLLSTETDTGIDTVSSINGRFMHHMETNQEFYSLRGIFRWMDSILRYAADSLKPCIFYLTIFPRGHIMRRRRLVRRWVAEGYSRDNHEKSAEETGEKFFSEILEMSVFQQLPHLVSTGSNNTRMVLCQVNGFIHEYILSRRTEENLVFELGGSVALIAQRMCRHLIIQRNWDRDRNVFESIDFSRLRSLTVFGKWKSFFISKSMKLLRVLDLEDAFGVTDGDLERMVQELSRLKFLSLRGCMNITNLPSSIEDLRQLQTLDVRGTSIATLPENIIMLHKLQYIRAGTIAPASIPPVSSSCFPKFCRHRHIVGVQVPGGIGTLAALHTLGVVNVGTLGGKYMVKELKRLTQLHKLGVSGISRKNIKNFFSAIEGHVHLESLSVNLDKDNELCFLRNDNNQDWFHGTPLPTENLRSLKLYGLNHRLPIWSEQLIKLTKLDLEIYTLVEDDLKVLGRLPDLCILRVKKLQHGELHFQVLMVREEGAREEADGEVLGGEEAYREDAGGEEADGEVLGGEEAYREDAGGEEADGEEAYGELLGGEEADREEAGGEEADGEEADGEEAYGEVLGGEEADREEAGGEEVDGEEADGEEAVREEVHSYKKVKVLEIACGCSSGNLHVTFGSKTMKKLELLKVDCCGGSPLYQFSGLENLRELKQVLLFNASNAETLKEQLEGQLANHPSSVKPVVKLDAPSSS